MSERTTVLAPRQRRPVDPGFVAPVPAGLTAFRFITGDGRRLLVFANRIKQAYHRLNQMWILGLNIDGLKFDGEGEPPADDPYEWRRIR